MKQLFLKLKQNNPKTAEMAQRIFRFVRKSTALLLYYPRAFRFMMRQERPEQLHIGCGRNRLEGWINADITPDAELIVFLQKRLPFPRDSLRLIYSEHVLEHVSYSTGVFFLREAYRTLKPGGIIRIAMPDLDDLIEGYQNDWRRFDWLQWPEFAFVKTRAEMMNIAFRWWGHQHLYNREELARALRDAGFMHYRFCSHGESEMPELCGLETRKDSLLIAEAVKD